MRRRKTRARSNWKEKTEELGLVFGSPAREADGSYRPYWDESVHYEFGMDEVLSLEADVELLQSMCLDAVDHVITTERYKDFGIPEWAWPHIAESWKRHDPHLYGRFDLRYDGSGPGKLLEYNADTPTSLLEASVVQWHWLSECHEGDDQWNSIHEQLVARWSEIRDQLATNEAHFTWSSGDTSGEDNLTAAYLQETAAEAGMDTVGLAIEQIGWDDVLERFVDLEEAPMNSVIKIYPWEWLVYDAFGEQAITTLPRTQWIEPLWKMLLSNKALLAILWEMHPGHPNLLPTFLDDPGLLTEYVRKPKLGREGGNIQVVAPGWETETGGVYGEEGFVYQAFDPLPEFDKMRPALGAWVVGDTSAGLGIRETTGLITDDGAAFVPHRIPGGG